MKSRLETLIILDLRFLVLRYGFIMYVLELNQNARPDNKNNTTQEQNNIDYARPSLQAVAAKGHIP